MASAAERVAANPLWYHTIDVVPGVTTPGWFDLRPIADRMPWPDVRGKRCLDVGTYDGYLAFELERRGAAEIVATDISDHSEWDWPTRLRAAGTEALRQIAGPQKGLGFEIARELRESKVVKEEINTYDLSPERVGVFDVVVCGSLMLHLRDPLRALAAIRSVTGGSFLSAEEVRPDLSLISRKRPMADLNGLDTFCTWWVPNVAGHRRMVEASGFEVERATGVYAIPYGPGHPPLRLSPSTLGTRALHYAAMRGFGLPTAAVLARPL